MSMKPTEEGTRQWYALLIAIVAITFIVTVAVATYYSIKVTA